MTKKAEYQSNRIYFNSWGSDIKRLKVPAYAMACPDGMEGNGSRAAASIAKKNNLEVVTLRPDGFRVSDGENGELLTFQTYQVTLGKPCRNGGFNTLRQAWICVQL